MDLPSSARQPRPVTDYIVGRPDEEEDDEPLTLGKAIYDPLGVPEQHKEKAIRLILTFLTGALCNTLEKEKEAIRALRMLGVSVRSRVARAMPVGPRYYP